MLALILAAAVMGDDPKAKSPKASTELDSTTVKGIQKRLKGKATYIRKTGELSIVYDFRTPKQLEDFEFAVKPTLKGRMMVLDTDAFVKLPVKWQSVQINATVTSDRMNGPLVKSESGINFRVGAAHPDTLILEARDKRASVIVPAPDRDGYVPVSFEASDRRVAGSWAKSRVGIDGPGADVGTVELGGGEHTFGWSNITFKGIVDPKWAKEFATAK